MVCSGAAEERERLRDGDSMDLGTERSKPLHNFTLPCLRWGGHKYLRCRKADFSAAVDRRSPDSRFAGSSRPPPHRREADFARRRLDSERRTARASRSRIDGDGGIEAVRERLMFDLRTAAERMKDAILREEEESAGVAPAEDARPWNLRARAAAGKAPLGGGEKATPSWSGGGATEMEERAKFSVSLSRKEIEDDYAAMLGERPRRRPKKRPRNVQKQLDSLFPGLWLTEVSEDMYKVPELPDSGKR